MNSETDLPNTVFEIKIERHSQFNKQRGTILTWKKNSQDDDDDVAISFQEIDGVKEIWKFICENQGKTFKDESFDYDDEEEILPIPIIENISEIAREIGSSLLTNKVNKIQEHIICDRVLNFFILGKNDQTVRRFI